MDTLDTVSGLGVFAQQLHEHSGKVHESVELIQPLVDALLAEDYEEIEALHEQVSKITEEANQIRFSLYGQIKDMHFRSVDGYAFSRYLACQGRMADAAEEFADLLMQRKTSVASELRPDLHAFVAQAASVGKQIMNLVETLSSLTDAVSADAEAVDAIAAIEAIIDGSRRARRLGMSFAQHLHSLETQLDPVTVVFLDRCCTALKGVTDNAERTANHLCLMA